MNMSAKFVERLGTATIAGVSVPLDIVIEVSRDGHTATVEGAVLLPGTENTAPANRRYPATPLRNRLRAEYRSWHMRIQPTKIVHVGVVVHSAREPERMDPRFRRYVARDKDAVEIETLWGINPEHRNVMRNDERAAFRGIARKALCRVLRKCAELFPGARVLLVMADGYVLGTDEAHYGKLHPSWKNTKPLADMYARSLGVRVVDVIDSSVYMTGTVPRALARCAGRNAGDGRPPRKRVRKT